MKVLTFGKVPRSVVLVYERESYCSWICAVCNEVRERKSSVREVRRNGDVLLMCLEHDPDDLPPRLCDCECHHPNYDKCRDCGHYLT